MLSTFMVNDLPDPVLLSKVVDDLSTVAAKAAKGEHRVAACGEGASLLWAQGKAEAAIRLERLWTELANTYAMDVLCGYPLGSSQSREGGRSFEEIFAEHSAVHSR